MGGEYSETDVVGTAYVRSHQIVINNPDEGAPSGVMFREKILTMADGRVSLPHTSVPIVYDPAKNLTLLNPETGEAFDQATLQYFANVMVDTGTLPMTFLFVMLFSLFVQESTAFDAPVA